MRRALQLAERGRGRTSPNPVVGAVVVRGGEVVGEGWHRALGEHHAEVVALERAGRSARGATLYVTLEPCAHVGRTPPCVDAVIRAGIRRCVVAVKDPHRLVYGKGLRSLRRAGIGVEVGLLAAEARRALGGYWLTHTERRPRVTWKAATSADGRIADAAGRSRWITGPDARRAGHALRALSDAIVIGANTVRRDDPRLTARPSLGGRQPLRIVCDTRLSLPAGLNVFSGSLVRGTVVACGRRAPRSRERALGARGITVWRLPAGPGGVSPRALARRLAALGRHEVLIEGGAALGTSWWRAGLVDRVALFMAPRLIGAEGLPWCGPLGRQPLARAKLGRVTQLSPAGADACVMFEW